MRVGVPGTGSSNILLEGSTTLFFTFAVGNAKPNASVRNSVSFTAPANLLFCVVATTERPPAIRILIPQSAHTRIKHGAG